MNLTHELTACVIVGTKDITELLHQQSVAEHVQPKNKSIFIVNTCQCKDYLLHVNENQANKSGRVSKPRKEKSNTLA